MLHMVTFRLTIFESQNNKETNLMAIKKIRLIYLGLTSAYYFLNLFHYFNMLVVLRRYFYTLLHFVGRRL